MESIYGKTKEQLETFFIENGDKKFRAIQVFEGLYKQRVKKFDDIKNISNDAKKLLRENFNNDYLKIIAKQSDKDVWKYLFELNDGEKVEAVVMNHDYGLSLCVSTQVGCNMGCVFCESGRLKKVRNLETYEMVLQLLTIEEDLSKRISSVVLMGIGEPLDNYDNVINFIKILNEHKGIDIGIRHITISTCGLVPKIEKLIDENMQVNLAISLHAPNDELRKQIMPIAKVYDINVLMKTVKKYIDKTSRRVTFEYIMLSGVNDTEECAKELAGLLRGINGYVNLIPYNKTSSKYEKSNSNAINKFYDTLKKLKINVTVRREFGSKVDAACGQLRSKY